VVRKPKTKDLIDHSHRPSKLLFMLESRALEKSVSQTDIEVREAKQSAEKAGSQEARNPLKEFHDASEALDKAIESLED